jgi:glyoxylase-like metal-dependent hydrolase (beta-lactamase superfamily II)
MRVHHLNCGTMRPPGGRLVDGGPGVFRRAEVVCHCLLVETGTGLVLIDTGFGTPADDRPAQWLGRGFASMTRPATDRGQAAVRQIERLGFSSRDVRHIVLTHLDLDHAGGLVDFPDATVHVHATELSAAQRPRTALARSRYRAIQFAHQPRWTAYADPGEPWLGFDAIRGLDGLPPEILLIPLAGHTRGHTGIAVDTGHGWLLHAGDAYFHPGEIDIRPHCPPALTVFESILQVDKRARVRNQQRLRELARTHSGQVQIFSAHNAAEYHSYTTTPYPADTARTTN